MPIARMNAASLLQPATVRVRLPGETKREVIEELVGLITGHPAVHDAEALRQAVWSREEIMSTGVGKGLGLPHAKSSAVAESIAAFGVTQHPIDFGAIDDQPVRLVFLLAGPESAKSEHIRILSRVSRLMNRQSFRQQLLEAETPEEVVARFHEAEEDIMGS